MQHNRKSATPEDFRELSDPLRATVTRVSGTPDPRGSRQCVIVAIEV